MSRARKPPKSIISGIYKTIDYMAAILLLTGQVTSSGVFVSPNGLWVSITGPILGGIRLSGKSFAANVTLDAIDIITALLLILGQITVTGPWISSGSFSLVISGPVFGVTKVPMPVDSSERANEFGKQFRQLLVTRFFKESL